MPPLWNNVKIKIKICFIRGNLIDRVQFFLSEEKIQHLSECFIGWCNNSCRGYNCFDTNRYRIWTYYCEKFPRSLVIPRKLFLGIISSIDIRTYVVFEMWMCVELGIRKERVFSGSSKRDRNGEYSFCPFYFITRFKYNFYNNDYSSKIH